MLIRNKRENKVMQFINNYLIIFGLLMVYFKGSMEAFPFSKSNEPANIRSNAYYTAASELVNTCTLFTSTLYTKPHTFHTISPVELLLFLYCSQIDPHYMLLIYLPKKNANGCPLSKHESAHLFFA